MIQVGVFYPNPEDTTSFYRGAGPFQMLRKLIPELKCYFLKNTAWSTLRQFDLIFVQRPFEKQCVDLLTSAKQCGIPTWVDHDDDFTSIPKDNPAFDFFSDDEIQSNFKKCLELASFVTVTTEALQKTLKQWNDNVLIIPNAHDDYLLGPCAPEEKRSNTIVWRGSNTHQNDLLHFKDEIIALGEKFPDFEWHFLGYDPFFITSKIRHKFHKARPVIDYFALIKHLRPAVLMCPLVDVPFNHAKSNIAWLEATFAGAVTVGPSFDHWQRPGVFNYTNPESFYDKVQSAIASLTGEVTQETAIGAAYIRKNLSLSVTNQARAALVRGVYEKTI